MQQRLIGEHSVNIPDAPRNKKEILFFDLPKSKQRWLRIEFPEIFLKFIPNYTVLNSDSTYVDDKGLLASLNVEDSTIVIDLVLQEKHRRENGVHFYNNGKIDYLTGSHYYMLQWCKMYAVNSDYSKFKEKFGDDIDRNTYERLYADYGRFLKFQQDIFLLIEFVDNDSETLGLFLTKAKKVGMTMLFACHYLNLSTSYRGRQMGQMSKKAEDAVKTNMLYFYHAFDGLPAIMKPSVSVDARATGDIMFGVKTFKGNNLEKTALAKISQDDALNTRVFCAPTKIKGFDAPVVFRAWLDEFPKMMQESHVSPKAIFDTTQATLKFQNDINGKLYITSYTPEETDEGANEARIIYFESKLITKKGTSRTQSELICYHVSSLYSYLSCIDQYGECDEKEANRRIEESLAKVKGDPRKFQALKRQLARNEREAWEVGGTKSTFNVLELTKHLHKLEEDAINAATPPYKMGYLKWENELWELGKKDRRPKGQFCKVKFVELTIEDIENGVRPRLFLYRNIPRDKQNESLSFGRDDNGNLLPPSRFDYVGGIDPTQYASSADLIEFSNNASYTMNFSDMLKNSASGTIETKVIVSKYLFRPESPKEAYEDIVKEIIFFGKLCIVEANAPHMVTMMFDEGLGYYMLVKNKDKSAFTLWKAWMKLGEDFNYIKRTANADQNDLLELMVRLATNYIEVIKGEPNLLETINDIDLIKSLINFNSKETKKSDSAMAWMYCLLAYDVYYQSLFEYNDNDYSLENFGAIFNALTVID